MKKLQENSIFNSADLDGDGVVTDEELAIHERMLKIENNDAMEDEDAKRDSQRKMAWFSLAGFLLFPFSVVITEALELSTASALLADMSSIYYLSVSALLGAYFGFTNVNNK